MNIKSDSRKIEPGDTFIALDGVKHHGSEYIMDAIQRGASRVICKEGNYDVETVLVPDTHEYLIDYLEGQGVVLPKDIIKVEENEVQSDSTTTQVEPTTAPVETKSVENITPVSQSTVQPQPQVQTTTINQGTGMMSSQIEQPSSVFMNHQAQTPVQPVNNQNTSDVESLF